MSWRTARPHPGSGRPRGAAPGARAKAHSGSARSPARPPRASGALRPARGEAAPPRRPSFLQIGGRPGPGNTAPPGPRALGSGRRPSLTAPGDARRGNLQPPGNLDLASPGDRSQPSFLRSQWTRAPAGIGTVQTPRRRARAGFLSCPPRRASAGVPLPTQTQSGLPADSTSSPPSLLPLTSVHLFPIFLPKAPRQRWT